MSKKFSSFTSQAKQLFCLGVGLVNQGSWVRASPGPSVIHKYLKIMIAKKWKKSSPPRGFEPTAIFVKHETQIFKSKIWKNLNFSKTQQSHTMKIWQNGLLCTAAKDVSKLSSYLFLLILFFSAELGPFSILKVSVMWSISKKPRLWRSFFRKCDLNYYFPLHFLHQFFLNFTQIPKNMVSKFRFSYLL